jgi:hypothetical protein
VLVLTYFCDLLIEVQNLPLHQPLSLTQRSKTNSYGTFSSSLMGEIEEDKEEISLSENQLDCVGNEYLLNLSISSLIQV